jgi:hypothetical protein
MSKLKIFGALAVSVLVLTGCASSADTISSPSSAMEATSSQPKDELQTEKLDEERLNAFEEGCQDYFSGEISGDLVDIYRPLLDDVCTDLEMDYDLIELIAGPKVDQENLDYYLATHVFGLSYWSRYSVNGMTPRVMLVVMEEEQEFWQEQLDRLLAITPTWFGPSDEGGRCYAAEAAAYCTKLYVGNEGSTPGDYDVSATMIGSRLEWTPNRRVSPLHQSAHSFQTAAQLGNWRFWFIEGQATYFEIATSFLIPDEGYDDWRTGMFEQSYREDIKKFTAETSEEAYQHLKECDRVDECNGFRYFGASLAHELLINTYGIETYHEWNRDLDNQLPDYVWGNTPQDLQELGSRLFAELFEEHFGVDIDVWEKDVYAPYLVEQYAKF